MQVILGTMNQLSPEAGILAEALVREYLHRWGLQQTLAAFEEERPRSSRSISNKNVLRKSVGVDRYASKLKRKLSDNERLPATLELMVNYNLIKKSGTTSADAKRPMSAVVSSTRTESLGLGCTGTNREHRSPGNRDGARRDKGQEVSYTSSRAPGGRSFDPRPPAPTDNDRKAFLVEEFKTLNSVTTTSTSRSKPQASFHSVRENGLLLQRSSRPARPSSAPPKQSLLSRMQSQSQSQQLLQQQGDLIMEDVEDDFEFALGSSPIRSGGVGGGGGQKETSPSSVVSSISDVPAPEEVDLTTLRSVEKLLLGKGRTSPPESWVQGLYFSDNPRLSYGVVQEEGGPCGVLAVVQAFVLDSLMEMCPSVAQWVTDPSLILEKRQKALAKALSRIIKQAAQRSSSSLKIVSSNCTSTAGMSFRDYMNSLVVYTVTSSAGAESVIASMAGQLCEKRGYGLLSFLLSVIITRNPSAIREDMDDPTCGLVGGYGYCTQDLVNLLLSGRAVTNVFDGDHNLDESTVLHGIQAKARCGFLTIFEWYKHLEVGSNLKDPYKPIWVVNSESHFSVLFATDVNSYDSSKPNRNKLTGPVDLFYYDELANQDDIVRLTVSPKKSFSAFAEDLGEGAGDEGSDDIPPLEKVIQTRWPKVRIDWNGSEPIL